MWELIIIEGLDWSWKDTQADLLVKNKWYVKTRLPFYENKSWEILKEMINRNKEWISENLFQSYMATNYIEHLYNFILPTLKQGRSVIMTRFTPSMIAYWCTNWWSSDFLVAQALAILEIFKKEIWRNWNIKVIYLNTPVSECLKRIKKRDEETDQKIQDVFETEEKLTGASSHYTTLEYAKIYDFFVDWNRPIEEVYSDISFYA